MYCRDLAKRFDDVWVISGPLVLSEEGADGKKTVSYQVTEAVRRTTLCSPGCTALGSPQILTLTINGGNAKMTERSASTLGAPSSSLDKDEVEAL